jgi:thiol-disulfide isomerase/thioredoxin
MTADGKVLVAILVGAISSAYGTFAQAADSGSSAPPPVHRLADEGKAPGFDGATNWLNSSPLTIASLRGKVVLINFWTYTCINWLRAYPYLRAWSEKYRDDGLVVIGVHSPEFPFEKRIENVRWATESFGIKFPVAIDSSHKIWRAYDNQYWPALYFLDAKGRIRHHQFGEGDYERSERVLQHLLAEAGKAGVNRDLAPVEARGVESAADWDNLASPENYFGSDRTKRFVSSRPGSNGPHRGQAARLGIHLNNWTVSGEWNIGKQSIVLNKENGRIIYRFHARDLHIVMGPAVPGTTVRFRVLIDGQPPATSHGVDIDEHGYGRVQMQRLYQLIRQSPPIVDRLFEIEFFDTGVEAFSATVG